VRAGDLLMGEGHRLRPPDVGALMGLGILEVPSMPCRAWRSSRRATRWSARGDAAAGQDRDMNSYALAAFVQQLGAVPVAAASSRTSSTTLEAAARRALAESDVLILNGGSSVG